MYAIKNISEQYVIRLPKVILFKALVRHDECFGKNCVSFLDFTRNYERASGILSPDNNNKNNNSPERLNADNLELTRA